MHGVTISFLFPCNMFLQHVCAMLNFINLRKFYDCAAMIQQTVCIALNWSHTYDEVRILKNKFYKTQLFPWVTGYAHMPRH